MGKFRGVLLASDFDDTLVDADCRVPARNLEAISYFISEGGRFTIATGRHLEALRPQLKRVTINAPVVLSNGARIYDFAQEKLLFEHDLPSEAHADLPTLSTRFPDIGVEIFVSGQIYIQNRNVVTDAHLDRIHAKAVYAEFSDIPGPWITAMFAADHPVLLEAQKFILETWPDRYDAIFSNYYLLELISRGSSKGAGVLKVAELLDVVPEHLYCAGDNQNDVPMLRAARRGYVPKGSAPPALEAADCITCPAGEGAIADVIADLDRRYF